MLSPLGVRAEEEVAEAVAEPDMGTSRSDGTVSGGYVAFEGGYATIDADAGDRVGAGPGFGGRIRAGVEFFEQLTVAIGIGGFLLNDRQPFTERLIQCSSVEGVVVSCGDEANDYSSSVGAQMFLVETGYHHRFRPWYDISLSPGAMLGYQLAFSDLERSIDSCSECREVRLNATVDGLYLGPLFRVTFGPMGIFALTLRSDWYLTGNMQQMTTLGFEMGQP
jgi:hypothetical protein